MTAECQENDGPLRVAQRRSVDEESDDGETGGQEAEDGPDGHPHGGQCLIIGAEDHVGVALLGAAPRCVHVHEPVR